MLQSIRTTPQIGLIQKPCRPHHFQPSVSLLFSGMLVLSLESAKYISQSTINFENPLFDQNSVKSLIIATEFIKHVKDKNLLLMNHSHSLVTMLHQDRYIS